VKIQQQDLHLHLVVAFEVKMGKQQPEVEAILPQIGPRRMFSKELVLEWRRICKQYRSSCITKLLGPQTLTLDMVASSKAPFGPLDKTISFMFKGSMAGTFNSGMP
jgi:hypothetical protein